MTEAEKFLTSQGLNFCTSINWLQRHSEQWLSSFKIREIYLEKFGFSIPNHQALETIAAASPILEIGAGSGYWSYELKQFGVDIIATDPGVGRYYMNSKGGFFWQQSWTAVEKLSAVKAIKTYPTRSLLIIWPDFHTTWPLKALIAHRSKHLFYVGEGSGGCTGNDHFHKYLDKHYKQIAIVDIPQFIGIHDRLFCYSRKHQEKGAVHNASR